MVSGPLVPLNMPVTIIHMHFPHQQGIDNLLKNFSTKSLHTYNFPTQANDLAKEYQHSPRFKYIYLCIGCVQIVHIKLVVVNCIQIVGHSIRHL